ncbi:hypothetical protein CBW65_19850 [Tumebacillus avium]|uniref:DUF2935 domain-containing protein n=1 Tax=Tumebacillus avium TaxID=1903704 RepID=A0A1Y0IUD1_9BACL|nr:DUF2935 domain-containing protein [Tumebacillus avium]ARU62983.1 hypothetical protein CBW65_19850 [Tumebacillus avium]
MRYNYGEKLPLRIVDEIEFWKMQEAEHTLVIRQLEAEFVTALANWENALSQTQGLATRYAEALTRYGNRVPHEVRDQIINLTAFSYKQSQGFIHLVNQIVAGSAAVRSMPVAVAVLNHIRRESEYFLGISHSVLMNH